MSNRMDRANSEIEKVLANIIEYKLNDPRLNKFITITSVKASPDFKYCKVLVSIYSQDPEEINQSIKLLNKSEGFIKRELANTLKMPSVPKIIFELDKGTANSIRINEILKTLEIRGDDDGTSED